MRTIYCKIAFLLAILMVNTVAREAEAASLYGRMLMKNGSPISGGIAVAFDLQNGPPPAPEKYFRPPDYMEEINNDGSFQLILPQGEYSIGAIKRKDGKGGPPRAGDIFFILRDSELQPQRIEVPATGIVNLGDMAAGEIYRPVSDPLHTDTTVTGIVRDTQGDPVINVNVSAVLVKERTTTLFVSRETDSSGSYMLKLPHGGTYNIGIWESGSPGDARKNFNTTIRIETGDMLQGVDLQLH